MKRLIRLLSLVGVLSACSALHLGKQEAPPAPVRPAAPLVDSDGTPRVDIDGVPIEKVPFHAGVSSATVERMAKQRGCEGGVGAGLITTQGPVEVYRMACDNGKVFMARCELRQCSAM